MRNHLILLAIVCFSCACFSTGFKCLVTVNAKNQAAESDNFIRKIDGKVFRSSSPTPQNSPTGKALGKNTGEICEEAGKEIWEIFRPGQLVTFKLFKESMALRIKWGHKSNFLDFRNGHKQSKTIENATHSYTLNCEFLEDF